MSATISAVTIVLSPLLALPSLAPVQSRGETPHAHQAVTLASVEAGRPHRG